jgi:hypothetical protein
VNFLVRVGLANTDDIHKSDASEEQECNGDLIEHVWQQDKSRGIANQVNIVDPFRQGLNDVLLRNPTTGIGGC